MIYLRGRPQRLKPPESPAFLARLKSGPSRLSMQGTIIRNLSLPARSRNYPWQLDVAAAYAGGSSIPFSRCRVTCAYDAACGSWVTITIVFWKSSFRRFRISRTSVAEWLSRSPVGSSASSRVGSLTIARAIATRCSCPPESCLGRWCTRSPNPTSFNAVIT